LKKQKDKWKESKHPNETKKKDFVKQKKVDIHNIRKQTLKWKEVGKWIEKIERQIERSV
jgi:hypothetical protein